MNRLLILFLLMSLIVSLTTPAISQDNSWEDLLGQSYVFLGKNKYLEAAQSAQEALKAVENEFVPNHPNLAKVLYQLAIVYEAQGEHIKAEQHCQRCLEIYETVLGKNDPKVAEGLECLAFIYQAQSKYKEAEPLFLRALEIRKDSFGRDYPQLAFYLPDYFINWDEPSIYHYRNQPNIECYRFTDTSFFGGGRFVRIIRDKSSIKIYTGYRDKRTKKEIWRLSSRNLKEEEWKMLTAAISNRAFWDLPSWDPTEGIDGGFTILEGIKKGRYHLVVRWVPDYETSERGLDDFLKAHSLFQKHLERNIK